MTFNPYICSKFQHGCFNFMSHRGPFDGSGRTCVKGLILEEADMASVSPASLGEVEAELADCWFAGCCDDKASLLSSLKM